MNLQHLKTGDTVYLSDGITCATTYVHHRSTVTVVRCVHWADLKVFKTLTGKGLTGGVSITSINHKGTNNMISNQDTSLAIALYGDDIRAGKKSLAIAIVEVSKARHEAVTLVKDEEAKRVKLAEAKVIQDKLDALNEEKAKLTK